MSKSRYRPEHQRMLNDKRWAKVKAIVDARARGLCEWCVRDGKEYGRKTGNERLARTGWIRQGIDHHHLIPFESAKTIDEAERLCYDPNNVVLLCVEHHRAEHNQKGYHKKENVKARKDQAFERWKTRQERFINNKTEYNGIQKEVHTGLIRETSADRAGEAQAQTDSKGNSNNPHEMG